MPKTAVQPNLDIPKIVQDIVDSIDKDREKQIITGRFGLNGRKQTLEEIGKELGITRERVRQIEKQVVNRLPELRHPHYQKVRESMRAHLEELGRIAPVHELASRFKLDDESGHAQVSFLANILPDFVVIPDNEHFYHSIGLVEHHDAKKLHQLVGELVETVLSIDRPTSLEEIQKRMPSQLELHHLHGLARSAKNVDSLDGGWGHIGNPLVNPKSIRDKIYVILKKQGKPMHFTDISNAIKTSDFKRRDVTTQAIHNELIKDGRFVLVGRGIYALKEWGYTKGTVADVIASILKSDSPLHRDEIIKRVLKQRQVKPTTIVLNLQGKKQFERVAKATYALAK